MIDFVTNNPSQIAAEIIADYETRTGKTLEPAQAERLLIDAFAYRESLLRGQINYAANQNLVDFSAAPALDYLGQLVGVTRLGAVPAEATLRFTLTAGHSGVTIPAGTRVASSDGQVVFATVADKVVTAAITTADVDAVCEVDGAAGNGYLPGTLTNILDPLSFVGEATNPTVTAGGADAETDEQLRERIKLAPASFSVAGPRQAYEFFAKSASALIIDVAVTSPQPGKVEVYPLINSTDPTPTEILELVDAVVNDEKVRPLTDTVEVLAPIKVDYEIEVEIVAYTDAQASVRDEVEASLNAFATAKRQSLGQDVVLSQIIAAAQLPGVYSVNVNLPAANVVIASNEFPVASAVSVILTGTNNG